MKKITPAILTLLAFALLSLMTSCASTKICGTAPTPVTPGVYTVHRIAPEDALKGMTDWEAPVWNNAEVFFLSNYVPQKTTYLGARVYGKMLHDGKRIYVLFQAFDRFVQAASIHPQMNVAWDTCAEFFMAPGQEEGGYLNMEVSLDGMALVHYHKDQKHPRENFGPISMEDYNDIRIFTSENRIVLPEITQETKWYIFFSFDAEMPIKYTGANLPDELSGQTWNANFYHCSEASSHPRRFSWMPLPGKSFHAPEAFGKIHFE